MFYNTCHLLVLGVYFDNERKKICIKKQMCELSLHLAGEDNNGFSNRSLFPSPMVSLGPLPPAFLFYLPRQLISIFKVSPFGLKGLLEF